MGATAVLEIAAEIPPVMKSKKKDFLAFLGASAIWGNIFIKDSLSF
jgi:hypothetical protein